MKQRQFKVGWPSFAILSLALSTATGQPVLDPEMLLERYRLTEVNWSEDGGRLAVVVTEPVTEAGQPQHIWAYDIREDLLRQLTASGERNYHPRWSPNGGILAFLSSRNDCEAQIYLMSMSGGDAQPLTDEKAGVEKFAWSPDGEAIAYLSADPPSEDKKARIERKYDEIVVSETIEAFRLRRINPDTKETRALTDGAWRVSNFTWRPDGSELIVSATDNFSADLLTDRFFIVSAAKDGGMTELARPSGPFGGLSVSPDNRFLAYIGSADDGPIPHGIFLQPLNGGSARDLTGVTLDRRISQYVWKNDGGILALALNGFSEELVHVSVDGTVRREKTFPGRSILAFDTTGPVVAYIGGSATKPEELWIGDSSGERQISRFGSGFPNLVEPEHIHISREDGFDIEAALFTPTDTSRPSDGWPAVLLIHGGPASRFEHRINDWAQLLVARGFAVVAPNIRGSTGYGLEFIRSIRGDWAGADYEDALATIDFLIAEGVANPEYLAIAGWSYGGYMSAWAITQTDRFKAAIVGAPMTDLAVEYGTEIASINAYDTWYLGSPYEALQEFIRMSPMTYVKQARTPTLILIGEEDEIDPIDQSYMFYRGLKRYDVETEMVIYPRELHEIRERNHLIDLMTRMVDWIEKYTK